MRFISIWSTLALLAPLAVEASVLAIDYGADFMKASLMKPGVSFDVLLNKDSKRKIPSVVGWKKGDRVFGGDAFNLASRFPSDVFLDVKTLQAAPYDSDAVSFYTKISTADVSETARKTVALKQSGGREWSVEELIAMQFSYVKDLAESFAQEKVRDVIITVPPYYSQFERDAIVDAIEISGLKTLALINDGTAVAVNYAMTRSFNGAPEYHIIYDAGASSIRATVVGFSSLKDKKEGPGTQISVAGVGWDRDVGGLEMDRRLREILTKAFEEKHKKDVKQDKRGMAKLWKEANRVKAILSANTEATSTVESLAYDIDFKTKVSRTTFEKACADLQPKFVQPIYDALSAAGMDMSNITSLIFTGGATRTPMIQAAVKAAVGEDKLAYNVNADEAAVMGAALHGASLSRQFKTKNIEVNDVGVYDVQASYAAAATSPNARPRTITTLIFPAGSKVGTKKTLTFKRKEDFTISLDYKTSVASGFPTRMLEAEIVGVTEAIANLTERGAVDPIVKATLTLSESGFVSVSDAIAFGEIKDDSIAGKLKGFFAGSTSPEETSTGSAENTPPRETVETSETASASSTGSSSSAGPESTATEKQEEKKKAQPVENTISLTVDVKFTTIPPMTVEEKQEARKRLRTIDQEETVKARREEARNTFESYLYRLRDLLDDENRETPFKKCSQASEREAIAVQLDDSFQWLFERGDLAETSQFLDKRIALETLEKPIVHRYKEIEAFPEALNNSQKWNWHTRMFLTEARQNLTAENDAGLPSKWTGEELDALEKALKEHESWLNEWVEKQRSVKSYEDPVIETTEMKARARVLETQLYKLVKRNVKRKVPWVKKPTKKAEAEEDGAQASETAEGTKPTASSPPSGQEGRNAEKEREHDEL
ncbi:Hypoxia up-regulated protein 1 [Leucoagaricus sp. SymC.cos]|nr:Hypoxia up-regulated protein 1 [Leucoagaricus sp. SymC.cos]